MWALLQNTPFQMEFLELCKMILMISLPNNKSTKKPLKMTKISLREKLNLIKNIVMISFREFYK